MYWTFSGTVSVMLGGSVRRAADQCAEIVRSILTGTGKKYFVWKLNSSKGAIMINWFLPKTKVHRSRHDRCTFTINSSQLRAKWTISKKALGSYSEDLAHSNWMILLQGMFRKG